jgi:hypothetical protein
MKSIFLFPISVFFFISCTSKNNETTANNVIDTANASFFPVTSFLKGQMLVLDSLPVTIMHLAGINGKMDTSWLKREQIRPLLNDFISQEISEQNLTRFFKETKFNDQTIDAITYTYTPLQSLPDSILLRQWNIYVNPKKGKVIKVFMVKQVKVNEIFYTQQLTWQTDKWAKIVSIQKGENGKSELVKEDKFVWGFDEN